MSRKKEKISDTRGNRDPQKVWVFSPPPGKERGFSLPRFEFFHSFPEVMGSYSKIINTFIESTDSL
jgi:hypothetical protein